MRTRLRYAGPFPFALVMIASLSGCGGAAGSAADPMRAQEALQMVLDAWKAGETPETLASRTPPIHVSDSDWRSGFRLVGYKPIGEGQLVGYDMTYPVSLELKSPKGRDVAKKAVYTISTNPMLLVLRQEG